MTGNPSSPEEAWSRLEAALDQLLDWNSAQVPFGPQEALQLYTNAYYFCTEKRDPRPGAPYYLAYFYGEDLHGLMKEHLKVKFGDLRDLVNGDLARLLEGWKKVEQVCPMIELIFFYMERHWLDRLARETVKIDAKEGPVQTIPCLYALWDQTVLQPLENTLIDPWFRQRLHGVPDPMLKDLFSMYRTISSKHTSTCDGLVMEAAAPQAMEQRVMRWWRQSLNVQAKEILEGHTDPQDLLHASLELCRLERERYTQYLSNHTAALRLARQALRQELLRPLVERLEPVMVPLMSERDPTSLLALIYTTLHEYRSVLADLFDAIETAWLERYQLLFKRDEDRVEGIIAFVEDGQELWQRCLQSDERLRDLMNTTIEAVCLEQQLAIHWPLHIDRLLRSEQGNLERACMLLKWIKERDLMASEYYRLLLHRLVSGGKGPAPEAAALKTLGKHVADQLLQPCQSLLKDGEESERVFTQWQGEVAPVKRPRRRQSQSSEEGSLTLQPATLAIFAPKSPYTRALYMAALRHHQQGEWPEALNCESFINWYHKQNPSRRLIWSANLSTVEIEVNQVTVTLSVLQFSLLEKLVAADQDVTYEASTVQPMLEAGLLTGQPKLAFNPAFTCPTPTINLTPQAFSTASDLSTQSASNKVTPEAIQIDRRGLLDAAIVRLAKRAKTISLANLTAACRTELAKFFEPTDADMEKELASLIEREYLTRDHKTALITYLE